MVLVSLREGSRVHFVICEVWDTCGTVVRYVKLDIRGEFGSVYFSVSLGIFSPTQALISCFPIFFLWPSSLLTGQILLDLQHSLLGFILHLCENEICFFIFNSVLSPGYIYSYICVWGGTYIYYIEKICIIFIHNMYVCVYTSGSSDSKESAYSAGDPGSIPGSERSPGKAKGNPFQDSCQENSMDRGTGRLQSTGLQS